MIYNNYKMIKLKIIKINLYIPYIKNQTSKRKRIDQIFGKIDR